MALLTQRFAWPRAAQLKVARESGLQCVLERLVTLCLDDGCMELCKEHDIECVKLLLRLPSF